MRVASRFRRDARVGRFALVTLAATVLLLILGAVALRSVLVDLPALATERMARSAADAAREIAGQISAAFAIQPRVVVAHRTLLTQEAEVLQFVTLEQTRTETYPLTHTWLGSTKRLEVEADVVVKAGFDLTKPFVVEVADAGNSVRVTLPPAEVLSTEIRDVRFVRDESGLWNQLTPADREDAIRELRLLAAKGARDSDVTTRARLAAEKRLAELLNRPGRQVNFAPATPPPRTIEESPSAPAPAP